MSAALYLLLLLFLVGSSLALSAGISDAVERALYPQREIEP